MSDITIALDAGHGGSDPGAVYGNRMEKDDALRLTKAVGKILEDSGVNVFYVRKSDEYETPLKKATDANNAGADYFISIHRNSSEEPNQYNGVETLVYKDTGIRNTLATNINANLEKAGFKNLGITPRPNLVVLKRTRMPAVLVEVGFINSDTDNKIFDNNFNEIAQGIADGILKSIYSETNITEAGSSNVIPAEPVITDSVIPDSRNMPDNNDFMGGNSGSNNFMNGNSGSAVPIDTAGSFTKRNCDCPCLDEDAPLYRVQVGAYSNKENADRMLDSLTVEGFPAFILYEDNLYKVQVGAFQYLTNAIKMEQRLRRYRYNTYIVYR